MDNADRVDLVWAVQGRRIPLDHGYALYSALTRAAPELHGAPWLAVHPMRGLAAGDGCIQLGRNPRLTLRLPPDRIRPALTLAGKSLDVAGHPLVVGVPTVRALSPCTSAVSRLTVVRLTKPPRGVDGKLQMDAFRDAFVREALRQLDGLGVAGRIDVGRHRQVRVAGQRIVGFGLTVNDLSPEQSLWLQARGIGGKHRMGCGVFVPVARRR